MKRRDFLHPRRLAQTVGPLLAAGEDEPAARGEVVHLRFARRAMATTFEVILPYGTPVAHLLAQEALDEIDALEDQLTVYRDHSEVSRLNARAARHPVVVEKNLFDLLALAKRLNAETDGAFDVAVGALVKTWGFFSRQGRVPGDAERAEVMNRVGSRHLTLDAERLTVAYERQGLEINLGSIGKGYALDRAAGLLRDECGVRDVLLHGGHSSVLALGREGEGRAGWSVGLLDPERPNRRRAVLRLCNRGMGTSAATFQHIEHKGRKLGHILDPRTGWPAEGMLSATVTAPTAAEADALATAFFIHGVEKARAYCATRPEVGAVLMAAARRMVVIGHAEREVA